VFDQTVQAQPGGIIFIPAAISCQGLMSMGGVGSSRKSRSKSPPGGRQEVARAERALARAACFNRKFGAGGRRLPRHRISCRRTRPRGEKDLCHTSKVPKPCSGASRPVGPRESCTAHTMGDDETGGGGGQWTR
jgi:hypothetical protein